MLRCAPEIFYGIEKYLTDHRIPYRSHDNIGVIRFCATSENGSNKYDFHINVTERSFWIEAAAPVPVLQEEKVIHRMEKFCNQANLRDDTGGFLVIKEGRVELRYRMYAPCFGDPEEAIRTMLPLPAQMLDYYKEQLELLVQGKRSVNEAMKHLCRTCRRNMSSCLLPTREESRAYGTLAPGSTDNLRDMMEAYFYNFENTEEMKKS